MKTKTTIVSIIILTFSFAHAFSQAPVKLWDADFGGDQNEQFAAGQQTSDGGYIFGGYSESGISGDKTQDSRGSSDYWIVKTDANGVKQWDARFGGSRVDQLTALQQTTDGGYILGGLSFSGRDGDKSQKGEGKSDYWIVKTDANGVKQWDARFGGHGFDELHALQQTSDGGYILGGFSKSGMNGDKSQPSQGGKDFWIVKTDSNGNKEWDARYGGKQFEELYSVRQTTDGGYILGGYSLSGISGDKTQASQGGFDYWIVKTNAKGVKQWDARFGGSDDDWLTQLQQTTNGGYILGGWSWSGASGDKTQATQGDNDYWIIKINSNGVKQWDADFGGSSNDYLNPVQQTTDGGYILGGYSSSPISGDKTQASQGGTDYWMVKTDDKGTKQWDAQFGGSDFDFLFALRQTTDGGYVLGGYSSSNISGDKTQDSKGLNDYWIVKTDAGGVLACNIPTSLSANNVTSDEAELSWDAVSGAIRYKVEYKISDASEWTTIKSQDNHKTLHGLSANSKYIWKVKSICAEQPTVSSGWSEKQSFTTAPLRTEAVYKGMPEVYPNPFSQSAIVSFSLNAGSPVVMGITDVNGRLLNVIANGYFSEGNHEVTFNRESLSAGIYFLQIKSNQGTTMTKMILLN